MAIEKTLCAVKRETTGKCAAHQVRNSGLVPGVYYNSKGENIMVQVPALPLEQLYFSIGETVAFNLEIDDNGTKTTYPVFFWDVQKHPYKKKFVHIDYYGVDLDQEVKIRVPLKFVGLSKGVKLGGKLETYRDSVIIAAKPLDKPKEVVIDMTDLAIGDSIAIDTLPLPAGARAVYDSVFTIISVFSNAKEEEEAAPAAAAKGKKK